MQITGLKLNKIGVISTHLKWWVAVARHLLRQMGEKLLL